MTIGILGEFVEPESSCARAFRPCRSGKPELPSASNPKITRLRLVVVKLYL
jgi:hypothetical protein